MSYSIKQKDDGTKQT